MPTAACENTDPNANADHIFWVPEKSLAQFKQFASGKKTAEADDIYALTSPEGLKDTEQVVPIDLRGISANFAKEFEDDFDVMVEKLGPKGTAEGLLKGYEFWKQNKAKEKESIREEPITVKEWKERLADDGFNEDEEDEEEDLDDDDSEDGHDEGDEEGEEEDGEEDEEVVEPAPKKKKSS